MVFEKGLWEGTDLLRLDQQGLLLVVAAQATVSVTADARAQAAVGDRITVGRRMHAVRPRQGNAKA